MAHHKDKIRMQSTDKVDGVPYVKDGINLCQLPNGLRCMGCCGLDFAPKVSDQAKKMFVKALKQSSDELKEYTDKKQYKKRYQSYDLHDCGMCRHLVVKDQDDLEQLEKKKYLDIYCPLHPAQNQGEELRQGECDYSYMCNAQRKFLKEWDEEKKQRFLAFIETKDPDWFEYSIKMHDNSYLIEFNRLELNQ